MRKALNKVDIAKLLEGYILLQPARELQLDRIVNHYREAYRCYHKMFNLQQLNNVEQHEKEFYLFMHTLNNNLPDEERMFESQLDQSYLKYLEIPRCGAIIKTKLNKVDHLLLVTDRRTLKKGFPKGKLESDESYQQCAVRETIQETGYKITLSPETKIQVQIQTITAFFQLPFKRKFIFFLAALLPNQVCTSIKRCEGDDYHKQITQFQWIPICKLGKQKRLTHPTILALQKLEIPLEASSSGSWQNQDK